MSMSPAKKTTSKKAARTSESKGSQSLNEKLTSTEGGKRLQIILGIFFGYQAHYIVYPFVGRISAMFGGLWTLVYILAWAWLAHLLRKYLTEEMPEFAKFFFYSVVFFAVWLVIALTVLPPLNIFSTFLGL